MVRMITSRKAEDRQYEDVRAAHSSWLLYRTRPLQTKDETRYSLEKWLTFFGVGDLEEEITKDQQIAEAELNVAAVRAAFMNYEQPDRRVSN